MGREDWIGLLMLIVILSIGVLLLTQCTEALMGGLEGL